MPKCSICTMNKTICDLNGECWLTTHEKLGWDRNEIEALFLHKQPEPIRLLEVALLS